MKNWLPRQAVTSCQWAGRATLTLGLDPAFSYLEPQFHQALKSSWFSGTNLRIKIINDCYLIQYIGLFIYTGGWFYPKINLGYHLHLVLLWSPNTWVCPATLTDRKKMNEQELTVEKRMNWLRLTSVQSLGDLVL